MASSVQRMWCVSGRILTKVAPGLERHLAKRAFSRGSISRAASLIDSNNHVHSPRPSVHVPSVSLAEHLMGKIEQFGNLEAVVDVTTQRRMNFTQLRDAIVRVTSAFSKLGISKGDVVCLCAPNCLEYSILVMAVLNLGAILSPVNPLSTPDDVARQVGVCGAIAVVVGQPLIPVVEAALPSCPNVKTKVVIGSAEGWRPLSDMLEDDGQAFSHPPEINPSTDLAFLPYSSGTTGFPKCVMLTHKNVLTNMIQFAQIFPADTGNENVLGYLPFFHAYGLNGKVLYSLNGGASLKVVPRFDDQFLNIMEKEKITILHLVPPVCVYMIKHPNLKQHDLRSVKKVVCAAAPLAKETVEIFENLTGFKELGQGYGLTEAAPVVSFDSPPIVPGSAGQLVFDTVIKVIDLDTGEALGPGQDGEICIQGPQIMAGYYGNPEATAESLRDGWLYTGDVGHFDNDGYFYITDRVKELIKYKAQQVAPAELEAQLLTHPSIQDVAVIGVPDPEAGELPKAFVVLKQGQENVTSEDVVKYIDDKVASYKRLRGGVEIIKQIPKSASGKILRRELKQASS